MDDKFYHGPAHGAPHFHSGPPGKRGLPGVSPTVQISELSEDGAYTITVTDAYHSESVRIPVADTDFIAERIDMWMDAHPEATTTVEDGSLTIEKLTSEAIAELKAIADGSIDIEKLSSEAVEELTTTPDESVGIEKLTSEAIAELKTTPNGSVTKAKLDTALQKEVSRIVDTFADLYDTTEDEVIVLEDNSYYGSGQTVTFMKSDVDMTAQPFFQRANGDYMVPKPRNDPPESNAPIAAIGETVASYINHPELIYGNNKGLFCTECDNEMDCSMFSYAILQGITYENSRYNGNASNIIGDYVGDNIPRNPACYYSSDRPYALKASEQAVWFAEQNRLFYIDYEREHPCSQLQPGDLIFESGTPGARRYLSIHHVAVVLAVYPNNDRIIVAQSGGFDAAIQEYTQMQGAGSRRDNIKITTLKIINSESLLPVFARPNYGKAERTKTSVQGQVYYNRDVSIRASAKQLAEVFLRKPLSPHKMYTFAVKGKLPQYSTEKTNLEMSATVNESTLEFGVAQMFNCGDVFSFPFVPPSEIEDATALRVRVFVKSADTLDTAQVCNVEGFGLYDSLIPNALPNAEKIDSPFVLESGVSGAPYVWLEDEKIHIHGAFTLSSAVSADGNKKLATLNSTYFGNIPIGTTVSSAVKRFTCYYGGIPHQGSINSSGEINVYYKNGEGTNYSTVFDVVI